MKLQLKIIDFGAQIVLVVGTLISLFTNDFGTFKYFFLIMGGWQLLSYFIYEAGDTLDPKVKKARRLYGKSVLVYAITLIPPIIFIQLFIIYPAIIYLVTLSLLATHKDMMATYRSEYRNTHHRWMQL